MDHQGFAQLLGNYGEFLGAIAVVATLAYLSVQVRANSRSTRSQTLLESSVQYQNLLLAPADRPVLQQALEKCESGQALSLSESERITLAAWYNAMMNFLEATWIQTDMGAFAGGASGAAEYQGLVRVTKQLLETPGLHEFTNSSQHLDIQKRELDRHYQTLMNYIQRENSG